MKVYTTEEKEVIMELSVKWAGNPNVIVAVKSFGLKATIQVVDLQVCLAPRVTLKPLVPSFPCFANIYVSLMEKGLILCLFLASTGAYQRSGCKYVLMAQTLEVQVLDPTKALKRPVGILNAKVLRAMKLKKKDLLGASDPYVKLKLTGDNLPSNKTTVKHKNLNPEWNEEFSLVVNDPESQALELHVGKHDKMGMNMVPLKELPPDEEPKEFTLDLLKNMDPNDAQNEKSRGQIVVELTYKPFKEEDLAKGFEETQSVQKAPEGTPEGGGLLVVIVHEAQDVEGKYHTNPHPMKKNRDPRWEEEFQFTVEEPPSNDKLHVEVVSTSSRNLLRQKESLGYADISLADVVANKRINERHHLIDSKNGRIQIELQWRSS
ncbi:C2 domain [Sesbania bispinosa]|nr:C2 domain [Sesbania bispinosa]